MEIILCRYVCKRTRINFPSFIPSDHYDSCLLCNKHSPALFDLLQALLKYLPCFLRSLRVIGDDHVLSCTILHYFTLITWSFDTAFISLILEESTIENIIDSIDRLSELV